jgi:hypothetical protein
MKTKISGRIWILVTLATGAIAFGGCADYVGVGAGYSSSYYVPDYRPFYADYFYDGVPWWGANYYYTRKKVVVKDVDKHINVSKNIYYGGHHLVRDWTGTRPAAHSGGFRRGRVG